MTGVNTIKKFQREAPTSPGVYRMFDFAGRVLYVGKAKNLAARIKNYTETSGLSARIAKMVEETARMEIITTRTENEALLLEQDLIKRLKPKYNILMRDDKSYPYLTISKGEYPRLGKYRGAKGAGAHFFGPFPSGLAVNEGIKIIEAAFKLRTCRDTYFKNRVRPCLLYQIKKCSAPCCGLISAEDYKRAVEEAVAFLRGRDSGLIDEMAGRMREAADAHDFESAIFYREQVSYLNQILKRNALANIGLSTDVIALVRAGEEVAIEVLFSRNSIIQGDFSYLPSQAEGASDLEIMSAFLDSFYLEREPPRLIITNVAGAEFDDVVVEVPSRGDKLRALASVEKNGLMKLERRMTEGKNQTRYLEELGSVLGLTAPIERIDVFDNSHLSGTNKVGVMICAGPGGFQKDNYRRYDIRSVSTGDDFGMMEEVLTRRYTRAKAEGTLPSLIILDGGAPQLDVALHVLRRLDLEVLPIMGIAKT
ncbi:MAG: excinuclease ABC subunit UvrC, partial [Rickettsiales bacterium]|nr:excinuclease ABC subunit UvrC [Rickettsiales bacterium]